MIFSNKRILSIVFSSERYDSVLLGLFFCCAESDEKILSNLNEQLCVMWFLGGLLGKNKKQIRGHTFQVLPVCLHEAHQ